MMAARKRKGKTVGFPTSNEVRVRVCDKEHRCDGCIKKEGCMRKKYDLCEFADRKNMTMLGRLQSVFGLEDCPADASISANDLPFDQANDHTTKNKWIKHAGHLLSNVSKKLFGDSWQKLLGQGALRGLGKSWLSDGTSKQDKAQEVLQDVVDYANSLPQGQKLSKEREVLIGSIAKHYTYEESKEAFAHTFSKRSWTRTRKRAAHYVFGRSPENTFTKRKRCKLTQDQVDHCIYSIRNDCSMLADKPNVVGDGAGNTQASRKSLQF